jgi:hypothetical protein
MFAAATVLLGCADTPSSLDARSPKDAMSNAESDARTVDAAERCNESNCDGCCRNGVCTSGRAITRCGKNGAECEACTGELIICKTDRSCGIDPSHVWTVQPVSATIATQNAGSNWDFNGGRPDPYVTLACPTGSATTLQTPTADDTLTPVWSTGGCMMTTEQLETDGFELATFDADITFDEVISAKGALIPTEAQLNAGSMVISNGGNLVSLTIQFRP